MKMSRKVLYVESQLAFIDGGKNEILF